MSGKRPDPPATGAWTRAIADINSEVEAQAGEAGVEVVGGGTMPHAGRRRPDLWETLWDVLDTLYGKAAERLGAALRDPLASEALVGVLETWEATDGTLAAARERHGIKHGGAVAVRLRETRAAVPNESANADLVARVVFDAIEIEGRFGIDEANELKRAARAYADAARRLRDALARAEDAAPKPKARQPDRGKAARQRLAADLCRALGGETDEAFWEVFAAVWRALDKDNADNPDPPNMQDIRAHLKKMRMKGNL